MFNIPFNSPWLFGAFAAIATHTSDTWMTELGVFSPQKPRLITKMKRIVPPGTSGGITLFGTFSGLLGSSIISGIYIVSRVVLLDGELILVLFSVLALSGLVGGFIDSLEGATIQAIYYCYNCSKETEKKLHTCGYNSQLVRGSPVISNDFVNVTSAILSAFIAFISFILIIEFS